MGVVNLYLLAYNGFSAVAWGYILYLGVSTIWPGVASGHDWPTIGLATWQVVEHPLRIVQTLAVLEIVHAALGVVRSPVGSTLAQVTARMWVLWCALVLCPPSRAQLGLPLLVLSWSIVEVPRYTFYALNLYNAVPSPLFFLRYHLFMVLYPMGFLGGYCSSS
jgi:very-long-chain (3R)-3-hydroxyacyl-CoA dehydratase